MARRPLELPPEARALIEQVRALEARAVRVKDELHRASSQCIRCIGTASAAREAPTRRSSKAGAIAMRETQRRPAPVRPARMHG
jgi:hypothetical protein